MKIQYFLFCFGILFGLVDFSIASQNNFRKVDDKISRDITDKTVQFLASKIIEAIGEPYPSQWHQHKQRIKDFLCREEVQRMVSIAGGNSYIYPLIRDTLAKQEKNSGLISMWFEHTVCPPYNPYEYDGFAWLTVYLNNAIESSGVQKYGCMTPDEVIKIRACKYPEHQSLGTILDSNYKADNNFYQKWSDHSLLRKEQIRSLWLAQPRNSSGGWLS